MVVAVRVKELMKKVLQKGAVPEGSFSFLFFSFFSKKEIQTKAGTKVQVQ